jgi:MFS transporter, ACS family, hexuronate transporter
MLNGALLTLCFDVFDTKTVGTSGMIFTFLIGKSADVYWI